MTGFPLRRAPRARLGPVPIRRHQWVSGPGRTIRARGSDRHGLALLRAGATVVNTSRGWRGRWRGADFYAALHAQARAARQRYNAEHDKPLTTDTCTEPLLPGQNDRGRYLIETGERERTIVETVALVVCARLDSDR